MFRTKKNKSLENENNESKDKNEKDLRNEKSIKKDEGSKIVKDVKNEKSVIKKEKDENLITKKDVKNKNKKEEESKITKEIESQSKDKKGEGSKITKDVSIINISEKYRKEVLSESDILKKRKLVHKKMLKRIDDVNSVEDLKIKDITYMFNLYDEIFFDNNLEKVFENGFGGKKYHFSMRFSKATSTAGCCSKRVKDGEIYMKISLAKTLFSTLFQDEDKKCEINAGLKCEDQLEAMLITLEHEMIHLILNIFSPDEIKGKIVTGRKTKRKVHGELFKLLAKNLFLHTDFRHNLGRQLEEDPAEYRKKVLKFIEVGKIVDCKFRDEITKVQILRFRNNSNSKTFRGIKLDVKKEYIISLASIIINNSASDDTKKIESDSEEDVKKKNEKREQLIALHSDIQKERAEKINKAKKNIRIGQEVSIKGKSGNDKFLVTKINRTTFDGKMISNGRFYRVQLSAVI